LLNAALSSIQIKDIDTAIDELRQAEQLIKQTQLTGAFVNIRQAWKHLEMGGNTQSYVDKAVSLITTTLSDLGFQSSPSAKYDKEHNTDRRQQIRNKWQVQPPGERLKWTHVQARSSLPWRFRGE